MYIKGILKYFCNIFVPVVSMVFKCDEYVINGWFPFKK